MVVVAKAGQRAVGVVLGFVGDLLAERIALAIDLAHGLDDVVGMAVGLGKNQGFGRFAPGGEDRCLHRPLHGFDHQPDLVRVDDRAVQLSGAVGPVFIGFGPTLFAGLAVAVVYPGTGFNQTALAADLGVDLVHVIAHVHTVGHRLLIAVLGHDVGVEEAKGAPVGCGGQADQAGIKVVEHLFPQVVDRAMAFVDDDEIEGLNRDGRVVAHLLGLGGRLHQLVE